MIENKFVDCNIKRIYLAIHSVGNSTMSRNTITKVLQKWKHTASLFLPDLNGLYLLTSWLEKHKFWEHTFILKALLKPLAKKPPKGAIIEANKPRHKECHWIGRIDISFQENCIRQHIMGRKLWFSDVPGIWISISWIQNGHFFILYAEPCLLSVDYMGAYIIST